MRHSPQRRREVLEAANQLIVESGLTRFSMLALAQRLGMSKETLYAWFGSKDGLLDELVQGNADPLLDPLEAALGRPLDAAALRASLAAFCTQLLKLLTSDRSVAINRGAVHLAGRTDAAERLRRQGRDTVLRRLAALMARAQRAGLLHGADAEAAEVLVALALRDWQIERLLGRMSAPSARRIAARAARAVDLFLRLYGC